MYKSKEIIKFEIVTPEKIALKEMIKKVTVPTEEGFITVLPKHMPLVGILKPGVIELVNENNEHKIMSVSGGFIEVFRNKVVLLADTAERAEEIDLAKAEAARKTAEQSLKNLRTSDKERFANINASLAKELARTKAVIRWKKINKL
ncbi:MAG: ATP synthase F1 subunit epsilon [Candidatus Buchananbacteria bacterium]|nr:ATP synthase F1 subunit epsilon [Candidatus Buchananbacteria bacterium]